MFSMKLFFIKDLSLFNVVVFFCLIMMVSPLSAQTDSTWIRVMSYNIHYGEGMDGEYNLANIAKVINKANPDLVGLQEISDSLMAVELGKLTKMHVVFGASLGRSSGYGDAILSKYPFEWVANHSIPSASSSRYQAMAVDVDLSSKIQGFGKIRLINTHFDWLGTIGSEKARLATVDLIEEAFFTIESNLPTILTADLNSIPNSPVLQKFQDKGWKYQLDDKTYFTYNSLQPTKQIDYVLFKDNNKLSIKQVFVMYGEESSDHLPIIMDLYLHEK